MTIATYNFVWSESRLQNTIRWEWNVFRRRSISIFPFEASKILDARDLGENLPVYVNLGKWRDSNEQRVSTRLENRTEKHNSHTELSVRLISLHWQPDSHEGFIVDISPSV